MQLEDKLNNLKKYIKNLNSAAVAYSAGVDSSFLLKVAHNELKDKVIALSAKSPLFPKRELKEAQDFCKKHNIKHIIVEIDINNIKHNPNNRCYICKKNIFENFIKIAKENNINYILEGSNLSDEGDYRPGMKAIKELNILSPLKEVGLTKEEIRILSNNQKPSFACLASRFVYEEEITKEKLEMVEHAEDFLFNLGFKQFRVRIHQNIARIEVLNEEFNKLLEYKDEIYLKFQEYGFKYITMDLKGYRLGSMNEALKGK